MNVDLVNLIEKNEVIGVALSGGSDSMALLNYLLEQSKTIKYKVVAINIEHGIRGEESISDSAFVAEYCKAHNIELYAYKVDCLSYSKEHNLSVEEAGRVLRYNCFFDAIKNKKCDKVATAHHKSDNAESVLLNICRGSGIKGIAGIVDNYNDKIIRPFLHVSKAEIMEYVEKNNIPYVTDSTNFDDDYTRNFFRLNIIPKIKEVFPDFESSICRLSEIASEENDYLERKAKELVKIEKEQAEIKIDADDVLIKRASIIALKELGVAKDWTKKHIDSIVSLKKLNNGSKISLLKCLQATREYDRIIISKICDKSSLCLNFAECFKNGSFVANGKVFEIEKADKNVDLKSGLFLDLEKIPQDAIIRFRQNLDTFTKFGGGTKSLGDYFTDKKIPLKDRDFIPVIASDNIIYAIFGVAVSEEVKVTSNTKIIIELKG